MILRIDIEDSGESPNPGLLISMDIQANPSNDVDLLALANDVLNSDVVQHMPWNGAAMLNSVTRDSSTTIYTAS